jgi:hypothetical protein
MFLNHVVPILLYLQVSESPALWERTGTQDMMYPFMADVRSLTACPEMLDELYIVAESSGTMAV